MNLDEQVKVVVDVIDIDGVTIETKKIDKIKHFNCRTPVPVPIHIRKAA